MPDSTIRAICNIKSVDLITSDQSRRQFSLKVAAGLAYGQHPWVSNCGKDLFHKVILRKSSILHIRSPL